MFSNLLVFILKEYAVFIVGVILFIICYLYINFCTHISLNFLVAIKNMRDSTSEYRNSGVRCLRISPDGQTLATGDRSGNVRFVVSRWWHWLINRFVNIWTRIVSTIETDVVKLGFYPMWNSLLYFSSKFKRKRKGNHEVNKRCRVFLVFRHDTFCRFRPGFPKV